MIKTIVAGAVSVACLSTAAQHDEVRAQEVDRINAIPNLTWTAGVADRFRGQPLGAMKNLLGVTVDSHEKTKALIEAGEVEVVLAPEGFTIPDSFDSETNWPACAKVISDIRDQSNCGCCWAFGGASAASDRMCIATNGKVQVPISSEDVCFGGSFNGCGGGQLHAAWSYVQKGTVSGGNQEGTGPLGGGFCSAFSLPHCHHHGPQGDDPYPAEGEPGCPSENSPKEPKACDADAQAPHNDFATDKYSFTGKISNFPNEAAIANAIMTNGPVETAFTVYADFENYAGGIYTKTSNKALGGHAVRIVGWGVDAGTKYWKVANSWNPFWGEKGYFRIIRGTDECGIEAQAMASGPEATWSGPGI